MIFFFNEIKFKNIIEIVICEGKKIWMLNKILNGKPFTIDE